MNYLVPFFSQSLTELENVLFLWSSLNVLAVLLRLTLTCFSLVNLCSWFHLSLLSSVSLCGVLGYVAEFRLCFISVLAQSCPISG